EAPGDDAEALGIEIAQIDDIDRHGHKVAWILFLRRLGPAWNRAPTALRAAGESPIAFAHSKLFSDLRHRHRFILTSGFSPGRHTSRNLLSRVHSIASAAARHRQLLGHGGRDERDNLRRQGSLAHTSFSWAGLLLWSRVGALLSGLRQE